jgi:hypothetical protein
MRKRRVFRKVDLLETSCVGIPAYPFAHLNVDMTEALNKAYTQLNFQEEVKKMEEQKNTVAECAEIPVKSITTDSPEAKSEIKAEVKAEAKIEEVKSEVKVEEKSIDEKIEIAVKAAMEKLTVERGLVETQKSDKELSIGELAMKSGLFQKR